MSKAGAPERFIIGNKRLDGRGLREFRKLSLDVSVLKNVNGSGMFAFGDTKAIAGVHGPREMHPKWMQNPRQAILRCKYSMLPFSTKERAKPGRSRRSTELSKVITEALSYVVFFEDFPKTSIDAFIDILQADASTRCAGINAVSLALADAGIPMRDLVSSCSVGTVENEIVLDVGGLEDNFGDVDLAVATVGGSDKFVLLQMDGIISKEQFFKALEISKEGCKEIYELQRKILREKYTKNNLEGPGEGQ